MLFQHLPVSMVDNLVLTADDLESKMDASVKYILTLVVCEAIMARATKRGKYSPRELRDMTEHVKTPGERDVVYGYDPSLLGTKEGGSREAR